MLVSFLLTTIIILLAFAIKNYLNVVKIKMQINTASQLNQAQQLQIQQLTNDNKILNQQNQDFDKQLAEKTAKIDFQQQTLLQYNNKISELEQQKQNLLLENTQIKIDLQKNISEYQAISNNNNQWQQTLELQFSNIIAKNSEKLSDLNQHKLQEILTPLNNDLQSLQKKLEDQAFQGSKNNIILQEKIQNLFEYTNKISSEANNLANALKGSNKIQGNWGEMLLENILQHSGLEKDIHYKKELGIQTQEGKQLRPDFQIILPDQGIIIVDSKISLIAYNNFVASTNESDKQKYLQEHIASMQQHIKNLAKKEYDQHIKQALDFTIAFVPIEPAYLLAIQHNQNLWMDSYERKILITSPTNFVACLRIIHDIWQRHKREENYLEIIKIADDIYEKAILFLENIEEIGKSLQKVDLNYQQAKKRLSDGNGNLIDKLKKLKNIGGIPSGKKIPETFLLATD